MALSPRFALPLLGLLATGPAWAQGDADFQARCSSPAVIRCYGFDDLVDLTTGHPRSLTEPNDSTDSRMYDPFSGPGLCAGAQCWALDTQVRASGASSLRFEIPSNSPSDTSGSFRLDFRDDFSVQIGAGEEFYVQYRERFSPEMLRAFQTTDGQPSGWKQSIVGLGDRVGQPIAYSCTAEEMVFTQNTKYIGPTFYHGCGFWEGMEFWDGTQVRMQHQGPPFCYYPNDPQRGCFRYSAEEWMTFKHHVRIGGWGVHPGNRVRVWAAREGQPSVTIFDSLLSHPGGFPIHRTDPTARYGKVWLLPYHTRKDPAETHPVAYVWYDELIVSRGDIPDPAPSAIFGDGFETGDTSAWSQAVP
jgi:hypothetical protein